MLRLMEKADQRCQPMASIGDRHHHVRSLAMRDDDLNAARGITLGASVTAQVWLVLLSV
ncbi:MAG TPA: hypothetical protein VME47_24035 [Acetobacteraceae bacterium]|nr:hypothetical protein [Acetobacteraceae bacterium]